MTRFDPVAYWNDRLRRFPDLRGTGTSFLPAAWQAWLYRSKARAYTAILGAHGVSLRDKHVVDLGCGTGFFEDFWERAGAARADGIDIVPEAVARLAAANPHRRYICADLSREPVALRGLEPANLVTAIDVLYHILDEDQLQRTLEVLVEALAPGGHLLLTDGLVDSAPAPHVRFRALEFWRGLLERLGLDYVDRRPVAVLANRPSVVFRVLPRVGGAVAYHADAALLRIAPSLANNWVVLARKPAHGATES